MLVLHALQGDCHKGDKEVDPEEAFRGWEAESNPAHWLRGQAAIKEGDCEKGFDEKGRERHYFYDDEHGSMAEIYNGRQASRMLGLN
eukprot:224199-Amphidinium_carterae.1